MKTILNTLLMTTMAVAAFGADAKLGFHVEFPFEAGKAFMPAGTYTLTRVPSGAPVLVMRNEDTRKSVMVQFAVQGPTKHSETSPEIQFRCNGASCSIAKVNNLTEGTSIHAYRGKNDENTKWIAVALKPVATKAD